MRSAKLSFGGAMIAAVALSRVSKKIAIPLRLATQVGVHMNFPLLIMISSSCRAFLKKSIF